VADPGLEPSDATLSGCHLVLSGLASDWTPLLARTAGGPSEIDRVGPDGGGGVLIV